MDFLKNNMMVLVAFVVVAAVVFALEQVDSGANLLFCMLFFVAISQGPIAVMAAADLSQATWHKPYKQLMFSVQPTILLVVLLVVAFVLSDKIPLFYKWVEDLHGHHNWLSLEFFMARNVLIPLAAFFISGKYVKESMKDSTAKVPWALFWVFTFVIGQTVVAVDWVMSLEYPWISTLFGAYFFVEAFYGGLAFAAVATYFKYNNLIAAHSEKPFKNAQMDIMTLFFGFSIFWAYQFFSQYLVIWYGNIPEEVAFLTKRLEVFGPVLYSVLVILFIVPFVIMLSRKNKANPTVMLLTGLLVWGGLLLERFIYLTPYKHFSLNPLITLVEFVLIAAVFAWAVRKNLSEITAAT